MNDKPLIHLIGSVILLFVVVVGFGFWYARVSAESTQAASLAAKIIQQSDNSSQIANAESEISELAPQEATINQYFVETNDLVPFVAAIQKLGKFLGADVEIASVSAVPGSPYGNLNLSLNISGSFDSVARTIGSIEFGPYDSSLTSLSFTSAAATASTTPDAAAVTNSVRPTSDSASSTPDATSSTTPATPASPPAPAAPIPSGWTATAVFTVGAKTGGATITP